MTPARTKPDRDLYHAFPYDPVHYPNVFGKTAAARLKPRRRPHLLIDRTLGENLFPAVIAFAAGNVMEDHHPVTDPKFLTPSPTATTRPAISWPKIRGANASRSKSFSGQSRRCRRCGFEPATLPFRFPAPERFPDEHHPCRDKRLPASSRGMQGCCSADSGFVAVCMISVLLPETLLYSV